jgi:hypothetical protein
MSTIAPTIAERRLEELGPWQERSALAPLGPGGLVQAWAGRTYSVQRYSVTDRPGWDRLHVQRHDGRHNSPRWSDWQALRLLLIDGADRLGFEVSPRAERTVDLAAAWHLWVLPVDHPLEAALDLAHELDGRLEPAAEAERIALANRVRDAILNARHAGLAPRRVILPTVEPRRVTELWGLRVLLDPTLEPGTFRLEHGA